MSSPFLILLPARRCACGKKNTISICEVQAIRFNAYKLFLECF